MMLQNFQKAFTRGCHYIRCYVCRNTIGVTLRDGSPDMHRSIYIIRIIADVSFARFKVSMYDENASTWLYTH